MYCRLYIAKVTDSISSLTADNQHAESANDVSITWFLADALAVKAVAAAPQRKSSRPFRAQCTQIDCREIFAYALDR